MTTNTPQDFDAAVAAVQSAHVELRGALRLRFEVAHTELRGAAPVAVQIFWATEEHAVGNCTSANGKIDSYAYYRGAVVPLGQLTSAQRGALREVLKARVTVEMAELNASVLTREAAQDLSRSKLSVRTIGAALNLTGGRVSQILSAS